MEELEEMKKSLDKLESQIKGVEVWLSNNENSPEMENYVASNKSDLEKWNKEKDVLIEKIQIREDVQRKIQNLDNKIKGAEVWLNNNRNSSGMENYVASNEADIKRWENEKAELIDSIKDADFKIDRKVAMNNYVKKMAQKLQEQEDLPKETGEENPEVENGTKGNHSQEEPKSTMEYEGIENANIHAIQYELDDNEKDEFLELKEKLTKTDDEKTIFEIRKRMAEILRIKVKENDTKEEKTSEEENPYKDMTDEEIENAYNELMEEYQFRAHEENGMEEHNDDLLDKLKKIQEERNRRKQEKDDKDNKPEPTPEGKDDEPEPTPDDGFYPPAVVDNTKQPPAPIKLPRLNMEINKKTGEVLLTELDETDDPTKPATTYTTYMDSYDYSRKGLKAWRKTIQSNEEISDEDAKYLKYIDPTIYNAYLEWDRVNEGRYNQEAATMYVKAVIQRQKDLENGLRRDELTKVDMPGEITVDIGWHPTKHDARPKGEYEPRKFRKLRDLLASHRANKILEHHDRPGIFRGKKMDLATVKDNRKLFAGLGTALAAAGLAGTLIAGQPEKNPEDPTEPRIETEYDNDKNNDDKNIDDEAKVVVDNGKENMPEENKQQDNRIYPGDVVSAERYAELYKSADAMQPNGSYGNSNQAIGVNKLACVINGQTFSTKDYSADEIYDMAAAAGVEVDYHVDKVVSMNGKLCVEVREVGNPSPVYIYNDNGTAKYADGTEFTGDVEYSSAAGWMKKESIEKADESQKEQIIAQQAQQQNQNQQTKAQEEPDLYK